MLFLVNIFKNLLNIFDKNSHIFNYIILLKKSRKITVMTIKNYVYKEQVFIIIKLLVAFDHISYLIL